MNIVDEYGLDTNISSTFCAKTVLYPPNGAKIENRVSEPKNSRKLCLLVEAIHSSYLLPIKRACSIYGANSWRPFAPMEKIFFYCNDAVFSQYSDFNYRSGKKLFFEFFRITSFENLELSDIRMFDSHHYSKIVFLSQL